MPLGLDRERAHPLQVAPELGRGAVADVGLGANDRVLHGAAIGEHRAAVQQPDAQQRQRRSSATTAVPV